MNTINELQGRGLEDRYAAAAQMWRQQEARLGRQVDVERLVEAVLEYQKDGTDLFILRMPGDSRKLSALLKTADKKKTQELLNTRPAGTKEERYAKFVDRVNELTSIMFNDRGDSLESQIESALGWLKEMGCWRLVLTLENLPEVDVENQLSLHNKAARAVADEYKLTYDCNG